MTPLARRCLILLALAGCGAASALAEAQFEVDEVEVEDAAFEDPAPAKAAVKLSAEHEKRLGEAVEAIAKAKRSMWQGEMKTEIEELQKTAELNAESTKVLEEPAGKAIEASLADWKTKMEAALRTALAGNPEQLEMIFGSIFSQPEQVARQDSLANAVPPREQEIWKDGVRRALGPERAAKWEKELAERKEKAANELAELLKPQMETVRDQSLATMRAAAAEISRTAGVPPERAEKLQALGQQLAREATEKWVKEITKTYAGFDENRRHMLRLGQIRLGDSSRQLTRGAAWKKGIAELLTDEEKERLGKVRGEQKQRRVRAVAQVFIAQMDGRVAFTAEQRGKLQPVAERLVQLNPGFFAESEDSSSSEVQPQALYEAGKLATAEEMRPVLDERQWKHWQEVCATGMEELRSKRVQHRGAPAPAAEIASGAAAATATPEDFEHGVSDFMVEKARAIRRELIELMTLRAEDVARVVHLAPETLARLQTAARGAVERSLGDWKGETEQIVRANLSEATPQNVRQRLASLEDYQVMRDVNTPPDDQELWKRAVTATLNATENKLWAEEVQQREAYRRDTMGRFIVADFDRQYGLTGEQWTALEARIAKACEEYGEEIAGYFGMGNRSPWYLQDQTKFLPLAAIPEKELRAVLSGEQVDRWLKSNECMYVSRYWTNVEQNHTRRVKENK